MANMNSKWSPLEITFRYFGFYFEMTTIQIAKSRMSLAYRDLALCDFYFLCLNNILPTCCPKCMYEFPFIIFNYIFRTISRRWTSLFSPQLGPWPWTKTEDHHPAAFIHPVYFVFMISSSARPAPIRYDKQNNVDEWKYNDDDCCN